MPGVVAGQFATTPQGVILHGTRSGQAWSVDQEYQATRRYVLAGADGLGWNLTVGDGIIAVHMSPREWGWNARQHSAAYLAVELAQARLGDGITDGQIDAVCWWWTTVARAIWPDLPATFVNHADLPAGVVDGKTDVEPRGQHSVRDRILARLNL